MVPHGTELSEQIQQGKRKHKTHQIIEHLPFSGLSSDEALEVFRWRKRNQKQDAGGPGEPAKGKTKSVHTGNHRHPQKDILKNTETINIIFLKSICQVSL